MTQLSPKAPEVLGCAYVVPLSQVEYHNAYGMSRDDEVEAIAMDLAMKYEIEDGWRPEDVSKNNEDMIFGQPIRMSLSVILK
jgi:hypothetical protein